MGSPSIKRTWQLGAPSAKLTMALAAGLLAASPARAIDVNNKLSVNGVAAARVQCQEIDGAGGRDECRGGFPFQPEVSFNADGDNSVFVKLGFAADNGLNPVSPFALAQASKDCGK